MKKDLFTVSKLNAEKMDLLKKSIDDMTKDAKTANDMIDGLIKWSYKYQNVFSNSHQAVTDAFRSSNLTLKNGTGIKHINNEYYTVNGGKKTMTVLLEVNDFGDVLEFSKKIKDALEHSRWYFKQNPLTAFGHYAKPVNMKSAKALVKDAKRNVELIIDNLDPHTALKKAEQKELEKGKV